MKKTTKILLVLAAVVAMTIGAVSTVMAADDDYAKITAWGGDASKGYIAFDENGEQIARGWAMADSGRWYFFDSGKMLSNTFITYNQEIYYLDGTGAMASNAWVGFDNDANNDTHDTKVKTVDKYVKNAYDNIISIVGFNDVFEIKEDAKGEEIFTDVFANNSKDKVLWCYFNTDGTMAHDEWVKAYDIWYYIAGAYCVMGDYSVAIDANFDGDFKDGNDGVFGFGYDGAMLVNWQPMDYTKKDKNDGYDYDTPYFSGASAKELAQRWTYYDASGRQANFNKNNGLVEEGWEKIDGKWCYFIEDAEIGMLLLQNTILTDTDANENGLLGKDDEMGVFYLDNDGFMVTGVKTFAKNTEVFLCTEGFTRNDITTQKFSEDATFLFADEIGKELDGVQDRYYYRYVTSERAADDQVFIVKDADITTSGSITVAATAGTDVATYNGQRVTAKNFFVITNENGAVDYNGDGDKKDDVILYFEYGRLQKNQAISFGEVTIGISANGAVVEAVGGDGKVKVAGYTYKESGLTFNLGGTAIIGLKK